MDSIALLGYSLRLHLVCLSLLLLGVLPVPLRAAEHVTASEFQSAAVKNSLPVHFADRVASLQRAILRAFNDDAAAFGTAMADEARYVTTLIDQTIFAPHDELATARTQEFHDSMQWLLSRPQLWVRFRDDLHLECELNRHRVNAEFDDLGLSIGLRFRFE